MPSIEFTQAASPVEYILYFFITMNMFLSATILLYRGVQKLRPAKIK